MVRKIISIMSICILLVGAFCTQANADTHTIYDEGSLSSTYVTYFKDIVSGIGFNEDYIAFRSGQYSYTMIVGDLELKDGLVILNEPGKEYVFKTSSTGYNSVYQYYVYDISDFSVNCGNNIVYSNIGDYPELIERGAKYEMLSAFLIIICCVCFVIRNIFYKR